MNDSRQTRWTKKLLNLFKKDNELAKTPTQDSPTKTPSAATKHTTDKPASRQPRKRTSQPKPKAVEWLPEQHPVAAVEGKTRFYDLPLSNPILHAISDQSFQYCTPIQQQILQDCLQGRDAIGQAQTGTGKTAAFLITALQRLHSYPNTERFLGEPLVLILAPTRELALQIEQEAIALAKYCDVNIHALVGGMDLSKQQDKLDSKIADIVVATPGRLIDFMKRNLIHLDLVDVFVLDEADRMLDMGFMPQLQTIERSLPRKRERQTLLFSATFSDPIKRLCTRWTQDPRIVEIEPDQKASKNVEQTVYLLSGDEKFCVLTNLLDRFEGQRIMVFATRRDQVRDLCEKLRRKRFKVDMLSGEVNQNKRLKTLEAFRDQKIDILVATDVAGRGIHVDDVALVVNYTLPPDPEDYIHRIGRTGRAGASGYSVSFACEDDSFAIPAIEELLGEKLNYEYPDDSLLRR